MRVKICCISSEDEAALAAGLGADILGLVSGMPSGPGVIPEDTIASIVDTAPRGADTWLLTSLTDPDAIARQHGRCGTTGIQLCSPVDGGLSALKTRLPNVTLVAVIHVIGEESVTSAIESARDADALLLDSGRPDAAVPELGGTGRTHDWALSRRIRDAVSCDLFLAGGLHADNVAEACATVNPSGVDVCSGVRHRDRLDPDRLRAFLRAVPPSTE